MIRKIFSVILSVLLIALIFPFYSGVVLVSRNLARGDEDVKVFSDFIKGVKENFSKFLLYGVILAFVTLFSYFSISVYAFSEKSATFKLPNFAMFKSNFPDNKLFETFNSSRLPAVANFEISLIKLKCKSKFNSCRKIIRIIFYKRNKLISV